ncbi:MAG: hypothetical protein E6Q76_08235 [Rhizobium sp.]|nr:MAG: hypothetical protein E6Q76_08235 [Rhizobium sp.]
MSVLSMFSLWQFVGFAAGVVFIRWRGMGWTVAVIVSAALVVMAPVGYFAGVADWKHYKLLKQANAIYAATNGGQGTREQLIELVESQHIPGLVAKKCVTPAHDKGQSGFRLVYSESHAISGAIYVLVDFDDYVGRKADGAKAAQPM